MALYNGLAACLGFVFAAAPWWASFTDNQPALWTSIIFGLLQVLASLSARSHKGWSSWPHWISLLCGVSFLIFPFLFHFPWGLAVLYAVLGYSTVLLNYAAMNKPAPPR
ncbi:SPW repeat protein [Paenibacillus filicis]|uniref:SPW repeat protein n=1 Tax=Paenibacillus filicis TaxID=669464 RepID=A0ABU9DU99_9BACL